MGAPSKRARKVRTANEFDVKRLLAAIERPRGQEGRIHSWSLRSIREARDMQLAGKFKLPARLVEGMRTDDALQVAYEGRLAPQRCIPVELKAAPGTRGASIANEAEGSFGQDGIGLRPNTMSDIIGTLVNHGVAFGRVIATPREDGSRIDFSMNAWPIEFVYWDPFYRVFITEVDPATIPPNEVAPVDLSNNLYGPVGGALLPIVHGDGRWVIFKKHEIYPWREEAALLSAALVWARHAFAARDWSRGSLSHGLAKIVGELPEGVALEQANGQLTPEAEAFLALLQSMADSDNPIGIRPAGSKTDYVVNESSAWQVFSELILNAERAAARIYLGTDGILGAQGGAPGVDVSALFGVAATRVQGDLHCVERALNTGVIEPWTATNFGDSTLAPKRRYKIPDGEEEQRLEQLAKRRQAFFADVGAARAQGFAVSQDYVDELAKSYCIEPPTLAQLSNDTKLQTNAVAGAVVTVNEARASVGLPPLVDMNGAKDVRGNLTVTEFNSKFGTKIAPAQAA